MERSIEFRHLEIDLGDLWSTEFHCQSKDHQIWELQGQLAGTVEDVIISRRMISLRFNPADWEYFLGKRKFYEFSLDQGDVFLRSRAVTREVQSSSHTDEELISQGKDPRSKVDLYMLDQVCLIERDDFDLTEEKFDLCFAFKVRQTKNIDLPSFLSYQAEKSWSSNFFAYLKHVCRDFNLLIDEMKTKTILEWIQNHEGKLDIQATKSKISINQSIMVFYFILQPLGIWDQNLTEKQKDLIELIHRVHGGNRDNIKKKIKDWSGESKQKNDDLKLVRNLLEPFNHREINRLIAREMQE